MKITVKQKSEFLAIDYYGADEVARMKKELEAMLQYRNGIKGKPNIYQQCQLLLDKPFISMYQSMIYGMR